MDTFGGYYSTDPQILNHPSETYRSLFHLAILRLQPLTTPAPQLFSNSAGVT